jgi:hypothetical protein
MTIAFLGWGSLLWEPDSPFDAVHGPWAFDGPRLPLEFSRISATRASALTLVIDKQHGAACQVAWCQSTRPTVEAAVRDLLTREGTKGDNIRHLACEAALPPTTPAIDVAIATWGRSKGVTTVIWTGLDSNFTKATGKPFSISAAMAHIKGLPDPGKRAAYDYASRAPDFIRTPLRSALMNARWFKEIGK